MLPLKLKWILRREFWPQFQSLLKQGTEVGACVCPSGTGTCGHHNSKGTCGHHGATGSHGSPQGTGAGCITLWPVLPLGRDGLGRWKDTVIVSHHAGRQLRDPGDGPHAPVSVPAVIALHSSSCSGNRVLISRRANNLWQDAPSLPVGSLRY